MTTPFSPPPFGGPRPTAADRPSEDWELVKILVSRWRILVVMPIACAVITWLITFLIPPTYTSTTTFVTAGQRDLTASLGNFANFATQLGVGIPTNPTSSPQFYGDVLRSRALMEEVVRSRMGDPRTDKGDSVSLVELYAKHGKTPITREDDAIRELTNESSVSVNPRTNIIELHVSSRYPTTAAFGARRFVAALNRFNLETRQSEAHRRRVFVGDRLKEAQDSLARAERVQQEFLLTNRGDLRSAPTLQAQYERIQRQIQIYQDLYTNFRREFETARVDEVNDTPVITIIDSAAVPIKASAPRRLLTAVAGAMLGILIAIGVLLVQAYLERLRRHHPGDYDQFRELRRIFLRTLGVRRANAA
jgi:uncharacterized protein involved in exopolysaccharide biosynthesis